MRKRVGISYEPGLIMIFRLFCAAVSLIFFIFSLFPPLFYSVTLDTSVWLGMGGAYAVIAIYLIIPFFKERMSLFFLPVAIIATIVIPVISLTWQPDLFGDDFLQLSMISSYSLSILLLFPLILTAWQYNFRMVILLYAILGAMDPLIYLLRIGPYDNRFPAYLYFSLIRIASFVAIGFIITELMKNQRLRQKQLSEMNERIKRQADIALELSATRERNRLSHELHDVLAHTLSSLAVQLEAMKATFEIDNQRTGELLDRALDNTRSGLQETRRVVKNLRYEPLIGVGFNEAIKQLARDAELRGDLTVILDLQIEIDQWEYEVIHGIYRIISEALQNCITHAEATTVSISVRRMQEGGTELIIKDDGIGFNVGKKIDSHHFGVSIMRERAQTIGADFFIGPDEKSGSGTQIRMVFRSTT